MNQIQKNLEDAKNRILSPENWNKEIYSKRKDFFGFAPCDPKDSRAHSWCALGSLYATLGGFTESLLSREEHFLQLAARNMLGDSLSKNVSAFFNYVSFLNDCLGHEDVMKMFDLAIQLAGEDL